MQGKLIRYGPGRSHVAFISPAVTATVQPQAAIPPTSVVHPAGSLAAQQQTAVVAAAPEPGCTGHLVLVGGLTDGLWFNSWTELLASSLSQAGWSLVQAQISSSYTGWGCGSLNQDATELLQLCHYLKTKEASPGVVLMGHSTGCQAIVRCMQLLQELQKNPAGVGHGEGPGTSREGTGVSRAGPGASNEGQCEGLVQQGAGIRQGQGTGVASQQGGLALSTLDSPLPAVSEAARHAVLAGVAPYKAVEELIKGTILHSAASDREWLRQYPELQDTAVRALVLVKSGQGQQVVERVALIDHTPISAERFCSLYYPGGDDDMFSSDLPEDQLQALLSPAGAAPCLVLPNGGDDCFPDPATIPHHTQRLATAISKGGHTAHSVIIPDAPHSGEGHEEETVNAVMQFITQL